MRVEEAGLVVDGMVEEEEEEEEVRREIRGCVMCDVRALQEGEFSSYRAPVAISDWSRI